MDYLMELATCEIEVTVVLLHTEEGVANSTARGRGSCDSVRWPWHSNITYSSRSQNILVQLK
jgi:hypothetical protein